MKKIALILIHLVVFYWAATRGYWLATKAFPQEGISIERWRQEVPQITNVADLQKELIMAHEVIHSLVDLLETLRWLVVPLVAVLVVYSFIAIIRSARTKRRENSAS